MLLYGAEHHRQPQTGALPHILGGKKRIKDILPDLLRYATAMIRYTQTSKSRLFFNAAGLQQFGVRLGQSGGKPDGAPIRHRIPRIG